MRDAFPEAGAVAVGGERAGRLPDGIVDAHGHYAEASDEQRWLALMLGADLAVGVHGSNLLLPSGLARSTLELVPEHRYGNLFQATLLAAQDPFTTLIRHRVLYGADDLADLSPERVAAVAVSILRYADRTERLLTGPAAGQTGGERPSLAVEGTGAPLARASGGGSMPPRSGPREGPPRRPAVSRVDAARSRRAVAPTAGPGAGSPRPGLRARDRRGGRTVRHRGGLSRSTLSLAHAYLERGHDGL